MITITHKPTTDGYHASGEVWIRSTTNSTEVTITITGVANSGGNVQLTASSMAAVSQGSLLVISGATGNYAYLNGRRDVIAVTSTTAIIDLAYVAGSTGTMGTAKLTLEKFSMGITTEKDIDGTTTPIATHYIPFNSGAATKDLSRSLSGIFTPVFDLTDGWHSEVDNTFVKVNAAVFESALKADYSRSVINSTPFSFNSIRAVSIDSRVLSQSETNKLLNIGTKIKAHIGTKIIIALNTLDRTGLSLRITWTDSERSMAEEIELPEGYYKAYYVWTVPDTAVSATFQMIDIEPYLVSNLITVQVLGGSGCSKYPLYWLNRYGGYEMYEFTEANRTLFTGSRTELRGVLSAMGSVIDKDFTTEAWNEVTLLGRYETQTDLEYLRDLFISPEIYDSSGNRVKILTTDFETMLKENKLPEVTILTNRTKTIW